MRLRCAWRPRITTPAFVTRHCCTPAEDEFLQATASFIREGISAGEPALVVVSAEKIALLRGELGGDAELVQFADMSEVGAIPLASSRRGGTSWPSGATRAGPCAGIGEPVGPDRSPAELVECQRHESLLNLAFAGTPGLLVDVPL